MFMQNMIIRDGEYTKAIFTLVSPQNILKIQRNKTSLCLDQR